MNESAAACPDNDEAAEAALLHVSIVDCGALQGLFSWPQIKSATTAIPRADPWLKVALSAGSKESVLRPSKPAPKTMKGDELLQEPRSRLLVLAVVVEALVVLVALVEVVLADAPESEVTAVEPEHVSVDAVDVAVAAAATVEDAAATLAVAEAAAVADPLTPAEARAALISSAVTSATRRFWVKIQPVGSFWSSPAYHTC